MADVPGPARHQLRAALARAREIHSRELIDRSASSLALIATVEREDDEKDELTRIWTQEQTGDTERLADEREQIKQFGRMIRMVGLRVAEGWR